MAAASMAASKLPNLRIPALVLHSRHLLHPSAAATQPLFLFNLENSRNHLPQQRNSNLDIPNFPLNFQLPLGSSAMSIQAARTYVPKEEYVEDYEDDDEDDDFDDEDVIENYSGSESHDEDEDEDEDDAPRRNHK